MSKPGATKTILRLSSAPGTLTVQGQWTGISGEGNTTFDCYAITVTDQDATLEYNYRVIQGKAPRYRLSVQELARAMRVIVAEAAKSKASPLRARLEELMVTESRYIPMIRELSETYNLNRPPGMAEIYSGEFLSPHKDRR